MKMPSTLDDAGRPGAHELTEEALVSQAHQLRLHALQGCASAAALAHEYEAELRNRLKRPGAVIPPAGPVHEPADKVRVTTASNDLILTSDAAADAMTEAIATLLANLRVLLEMDIALVEEFVDGNRVFRHVDVDPSQRPRLEVGQSAPMEGTYCQRVIDGRLPAVMSDTAAFPETHDLVATRKLGIGAYLSTPVVLANGEVYGTLCCISHQARSALGCRQVDALRSAAALVSAEIEKCRRA
jgi:GAF domain-containing protein